MEVTLCHITLGLNQDYKTMATAIILFGLIGENLIWEGAMWNCLH